MIPCTRFTRNNPGCRCVRCLAQRAATKRLLARVKRQNAAVDRAIASVRKQERRKRALPWEGVGRRD